MKGKFSSIWHVALALILVLGFTLVPALPAMAVAAAPTVVSAATSAAGDIITITFSKAMANPNGKQAEFIYNIDGGPNQIFSAAALHKGDSTKIALTTHDTPIVFGNAVTVSYAGVDVLAVDGGILANFTHGVVNTIPSSNAPVALGLAGSFAILTKTGITDIPTSAVTGNVGASGITGAAIHLTQPEVTGIIYADDAAGPDGSVVDPTRLGIAVGDMVTAYGVAAGRATTHPDELGSGDITTLTLAPGVYKWGTGVLISAAGVTLSGSATDVWIFEIAGNLDVASGAHVNLIGGAQAKNIFWQVGGGTGATLNTTSVFNGNILTAKQVIIMTGATLNGRALAQTQVTLDQNTVTMADAPAMTSISPASGPLAAGTPVTITGTGFFTGAKVRIGGTLATDVVVVNSTTITATAPSGTAGAKDVVVTNLDTQSDTLTSGFTYATVINIAAIPGVTAPVTGATPVTVITATDQYTGTVAWSPADAHFVGATVYTATITLTAKAGYTLTGVAADFFTVSGVTTPHNLINSGVVTAAFPATAATVISIAAIPGVTAPVTGATPVAAITATAQYTGTVAWSPADAHFGGATVYTATITLTAKAGYTLTGVAADFFTVSGVTTPHNLINSGVVTAAFPATAAQAAVDLGSAGDFVILAKSGISTTGTTSVVGDIGVSPAAATSITGFGLIADASNTFATSSLVTGKVYAPDYAPDKMTTAISDAQTAYIDAAGRTSPFATELGNGNISGMTLAPGLYKWSTGLLIDNTGVTLSGNATDVWIFQIAQTLTVNDGGIVTLSGGAQAKNIFWQVAGQTTLGTTSQFNGNILDAGLIVLNPGAMLCGRALAQTAVTLNASAVMTPVLAAKTLTPPAAVATMGPLAPVSLLFNQGVTVVDLSGITVKDPGNVAVTGVSASLGADNLLTIAHANFVNSQTYTVTIPAGAVQNAAGELNKAITWSFTTVGAYAGGGGVASGGGGGSSNVLAPVNLGGLSSASGFAVDSSGHTRADSQLNTTDGRVSLTIPSGTLAVNSNGTPLSALTATQTVTPPAAPSNSAVVLSYDFGPSGAQFVPPITLKLIYNPLALPAGVNESSLYLAVWDGTQWQTLVGTVDPVNHSISTLVSHFSQYAIIGKLGAPVTTTPAPTQAATPPVTTTPAPTQAATPPVTTTPAPTQVATPPVTTTPALTPTPVPTPTTTPWGLIIGIIAAVIVIGLIITLVARRKKSV